MVDIPKLTEEQIKRLKDMDDEIQQLQAVIGKIGRSGFDTVKMKENIELLQIRRKGLLKEFG